MTITIPALKKPTLNQLQKDRSWIKRIESDQSTEQAVEVEFVSVLKEGETYISGSEYETRLKSRNDATLGYQHMQWLLEHQTEFPELMALLGKVYIDFPALIVVSGGGYRRIPYVDDGGEQFIGYWSWLSRSFHDYGRIAVSSKLQDSKPLGTLANPEKSRIAEGIEKMYNTAEQREMDGIKYNKGFEYALDQVKNLLK